MDLGQDEAEFFSLTFPSSMLPGDAFLGKLSGGVGGDLNLMTTLVMVQDHLQEVLKLIRIELTLNRSH